MKRLSSLAIVLSTASIALGCSAADPTTSSADPSAILVSEKGMVVDTPHVFYQNTPDRARHHGGGGNLIDHGGKVLSASHVYTIFWGDSAAWPSDAVSGLDSLFSELNGSSFLGISQQYMRGAGISESFVNHYSDSSSPPNSSPSTSTIVNEACKVINGNHLTADTDALYVVYTSNFPGNVNFCAWHNHGTCNGTDIQVAYMPNTTGVAGCDPGDLFGCNSYSQGTRSLANVSSHEYSEAITDADLNAWFDGSGSEIGDKCAWQFSSCVNLKGGSWQLQKEWSNAISGCAQQ